MKSRLGCIRMLFVAGSILLTCLSSSASANETLVLIASFAKGDEGAIGTYRLKPATGELQLAQQNSEVEFPFFLALSPDGKFLYSIHAPGEFGGAAEEQVAAFAMQQPEGRLRLLNRQSARGSAACYLDVDQTGRSLVLANYNTGSVAAFPIQSDGSISPCQSFVQHVGSSVDPERQEGPHAHCAVISPDNQFVLSADLGLDKLLSYRLQPESAELVPARQSFVRTTPGAGPRHLTFHPDGQHVYVINELANSVTLFDYDPATGFLLERTTVSTLPDDFSGTSYCADLKITPDGRYLYGTNRGHDSIAIFRLAPDGNLERLKTIASLGGGPQNLAITSDGRLLLCANMPGNNVALFRIDPQTGDLTAAGPPLSVTSPACIMLCPR